MYTFKNLVNLFMMPLALATLICVAAATLFLFRRRRSAICCFAVAGLTAYIGATDLAGNALIDSLETRYPPLSTEEYLGGVEIVAVLGSGYAPRDGVPVTAALTEDGLARIVEGIRLFRSMQPARLIVSGGAPAGKVASALGYARLALDLGIVPQSLTVLDRPIDTGEEADELAGVVGKQSFVLVTSAYHMPRAMQLMLRAGLRPIPAPTGQRAYESPSPLWVRAIPSARGLRNTERAIHEYLGLAALWAHAS